jgi:hypothetical protein
MPPNSPTYLKLIVIEPTPLALHHHYTPLRFRRLLNLHEKFVEDFFDP